METNYKAKYMELRAQFMDAVDTAFRLGHEQGAMQAQMDQFNQQQQAAQEASMNQPDQASAPDEQPQEGAEEQPPQDSANPSGSELDQHIAKLESMLSKSEELDAADLKSAIEGLKGIQKNISFQAELKKSAAAIPGIVKALHKPAFKLSQQASHNMNDSAKKAVTMQQQIVTNIMKSWATEETTAKNSIENILNSEGLTKE